MGALRDLFIRIKGDNSGAKKAIKDTENDVGGLSGKVKGMASTFMAAAAAGAAAFAVILNWAKDTNFGLEAINKTLGVGKQLLTDLIMGQGLHLKQASDIAGRQSKIKQDDIREGYQIKTMQSEIQQLIVASADATKSHSEKLELLTQAIEKEKQLKEFLLKDAREELAVAYDNWRLNIQSIDAKTKYYEIAGKIRDIEGMDSRRLQSQFTAELVAQKKRAEELVDAFTEIPPTLEEIKKKAGEITKVMTGEIGSTSGASVFSPKKKFSLTNNTGKLAGGPTQYAGTGVVALDMATRFQAQMDELANMQALEDMQARMAEALTSMRDMAVDYGMQIAEALGEALGGGNVQELGKGLLLSLANFLSQFGKMLIVAGLGIDAFAKSMATGNAPLAIAAGAAMLVAAGAIKGLMASAGKSGVSGAGGYSGSGGSMQTIRVEGVLKGKDIHWSNKRYEEEN